MAGSRTVGAMRGKTVLFAWELGAGLGHTAPLAAVGRRVAAAGGRVVMALRDPATAQTVGCDREFAVVQAPAPTQVAARRARAASGYADSLALYGFDDPDTLGPLIDAWRELFARAGADLIVADHAPGASLAARGRWPVVQLGNGFTLPPHHLDVFPVLVPEVEPTVAQDLLFERIDGVLRAKGLPRLDRLPAMLSAQARLVRTIAWADPFAAQRRDPLIGPIEPMPEPSERPAERRLYAYINASMPRYRPATAAFAAMNARRTAYVRGADDTMRSRLGRRGVEVLDRPPPLSAAVTASRAVLSNGTGNTSLAALAAGRPMVAIPIHVEATLTARQLAAHGAVLLPPSAGGGAAIRRALEQALSDPALEARSAAAAREAGPFDAAAALDRVEEAIATVLADPQPPA